MATYPWSALSDGGADRAFNLVRSGFVSLFWRPLVLNDMAAWLAAHDYHVVDVDCSSWRTAEEMHDVLAQALLFPDYYGRNLMALNDCMYEVVERGAVDAKAGLVLVLRHYDGFVSRVPAEAWALLDIFASNAQLASLLGHRMLCLVQSDDPNLELEEVGAQPVRWNHREWLEKWRNPERPETYGRAPGS